MCVLLAEFKLHLMNKMCKSVSDKQQELKE